MTQVTLPSGTTSWTVPGTVGANDAVISVQVECYGPGGGGGGSGDAAANHGGAGGGGGGYSRSVVPCTPAAVLTVSISAGGAGGNGNANGANGVATSFNNGQVTANGGTGGGYGGATQHGGAGGTPGTGQHAFAGGTGSNSNTLGATGGGGGAGAGTNGNANSTTTITGATGAASGGTGGNGGATHTAGNNGALPGGGAGGAGEANNNNANGFHAGGTGGAGQIVLTYNTVAQSVAQDAAVDQAPYEQSYFPESDWQVEDINWGFKSTMASGTQMGGFRGFRITRGAMGSEIDNWGFNPPVVVVITPFDDVDQAIPQSLEQYITEIEDEQFSYNPVVVTAITSFDEDQYVITTQLARQQVEDEQVYPKAPISFDDSLEQYAQAWHMQDDVETWGYNPAVIGELAIDVEYQLRNNPYPLIQQVEDEQVYPAAPFLKPFPSDDSFEQYAVGWKALDQIEEFSFNPPELIGELLLEEDLQLLIVPYPVTYQVELDAIGQNSPFLQTIALDDSPEHFAGTWNMLDDVETFGFNVPELIGELLLDSELQLDNLPYPDIQQVEDEQVYPNPPFLIPTPFDDSPEQYAIAWNALDQVEDINWGYKDVMASGVQMGGFRGFWVNKSAMGSDFENWGYNPVVVVTAITPFDEDQYAAILQFTEQQVEDDQIYLIPYSETQEFGPSEQQSILPEIEDEQVYPNPPFLTPTPFDDSPEQYATSWRALDQVENDQIYPTAPFLTPFPSDDSLEQFPLGWTVRLQIEDEQIYPAAPFLVPIEYDNTLEQYATAWFMRDDVETFGLNVPEFIGELLLDESQIDNQPYPLIQQVEDEQFGQHAPFLVPFPSDDSPEQLLNKPYPLVAEDDLVFPPSVILPNIFYDTEFNPTMQQSYYFKSLEDEMFNWGYKPPVTLVAEDDAPYDSRVVQWQALDDDTNWGFNPPEILGELILDEELQMQNLPYPITYQVENDQVYPRAPFLTAIGFDDSPEQIPAPYLIRDDVDQQNFIEAFIQDDQPQPFPVLLRYQDDEQFSYNPAVVVVINAFDAEMNPALYLKLTPEIEDELVQFGYSPLLHLIEDDAPYDSFVKQWQGVDDDTSWGYLVSQEFAVDDSSEYRVVKWKALDQIEEFAFNPPEIIGELLLDGAQLGNPPYPLIQQQEDEQFGQHPPFLTPTSEVWELMGLPPNPPYPTTYQVELDAIGQNPPFIIEIGTDDAEGQYLTPPIITDDVDVFGYQFPIPYPGIIQDDDQVPQFPFWSLAWVEGEEVQIIIPPLIVPIVYRVGMGLLLTMQCSTVPAMSVYGAESDLRLAMECSTAPLMSVYDTDSSLRMSVQSIENHGPTTPYWNNS